VFLCQRIIQKTLIRNRDLLKKVTFLLLTVMQREDVVCVYEEKLFIWFLCMCFSSVLII